MRLALRRERSVLSNMQDSGLGEVQLKVTFLVTPPIKTHTLTKRINLIPFLRVHILEENSNCFGVNWVHAFWNTADHMTNLPILITLKASLLLNEVPSEAGSLYTPGHRGTAAQTL